eukprot:s7454_g3.t1
MGAGLRVQSQAFSPRRIRHATKEVTAEDMLQVREIDVARARFLAEAACSVCFRLSAMPPVPPLALTSPHGLGVTTPRSLSSRPTQPSTGGSYQPSVGAFSRSARHIVTPQVGLSAMVQALGDLKAPWEVTSTQKFTPRRETPPDALASVRPFSVGRARAQRQLQTALATQDSFLCKCATTRAGIGEPLCALREGDHAAALAGHTGGPVSQEGALQEGLPAKPESEPVVVAAPLSPEDSDRAGTGTHVANPSVSPEEAQRKEEEAAALRIQSLHRGRKEREAVKKMVDEETKAATKIQSVFRGQAARESRQRLHNVVAPMPPLSQSFGEFAPCAHHSTMGAGHRPRLDLLYRRLGAEKFSKLLDEADVLTKKFQTRIQKARGFFQTANGIIWHVTPDGEVKGLHADGSRIRDRVRVAPDDTLQIGPFRLDETRGCHCIHWLRKESFVSARHRRLVMVVQDNFPDVNIWKDDPDKSWNWSRDNTLRTRVRLATGERA